MALHQQKKLFGMVSLKSSLDYTRYAVQSFFKHTPFNPGDKFILIDNDGSLPLDEYKNGYPALTVHVNEDPLCFAHNGNQLLALAKAQEADLYFLNNDLIFTPGWLQPMLEGPDDTVLVPFSNAQCEYQGKGWKADRFLDLKDYLGHEILVDQMAVQHAAQHNTFLKAMVAYFYCVKIPYQVQLKVGEFDRGYDAGGGEDIDYAFRCYLAGQSVCFAQKSFILHFQGKSTWRGPESEEESKQRNQRIYQYFINKWGDDLYRLVAFQDLKVLDKYPENVRQSFNTFQYKEVIEAMKN